MALNLPTEIWDYPRTSVWDYEQITGSTWADFRLHYQDHSAYWAPVSCLLVTGTFLWWINKVGEGFGVGVFVVEYCASYDKTPLTRTNVVNGHT